MADELRYDITANAERFQLAIRQQVNGLKLVDAETGRFVKTRDALNAIGIKTQAQIKEEIAARQALIQVLGTQEPQAVERLRQEIARLNGERRQMIAGTGSAQNAVFSFGYILNDAQQFAYGFSNGVRAIANNLQPLIFSLSQSEGGMRGFLGALKGPAGLILILNAVTTALVILPEVLKKVRSETVDLTVSTDDLKKSLEGVIQVSALPALQKLSTEGLRRVRDAAIEARDAATEARKALQGQIGDLENASRRLQVVAGAPVLTQFLDLTKEQAEAHDELTRQLGEQTQKETDNAAAIAVTTAMLHDRLGAERALALARSLGIALEDDYKTIVERLTEDLRELSRVSAELTGTSRARIVTLTREIALQQARRDLILEQIRLEALTSGDAGRQVALDERALEQTHLIIDLEKERALIQDDILHPAQQFTGELQDQLERARALREEYERIANLKPGTVDPSLLSGIELRQTALGQDVKDYAREQQQALEDLARSAENFQARIAQAIGGGFASTVDQFSESVGRLIAGGGRIEQVFQSVASGVADIAIRVGKIILAQGIAIEAAKYSLLHFTGVGAIAAGAALIAIGSAVKGALKDAAGGGGGAGGFNYSTITSPGARRFQDQLDASRSGSSTGDRAPRPNLDAFYGSLRRAPQPVVVHVTGELVSRRGAFHASLTEDAQRTERLIAVT